MNTLIRPRTKRSSEVRFGGAALRPIADDDLLLEHQRFCGDRARTARTEEFCYRDDQMDREEEQFAHERNGTNAHLGAQGCTEWAVSYRLCEFVTNKHFDALPDVRRIGW